MMKEKSPNHRIQNGRGTETEKDRKIVIVQKIVDVTVIERGIAKDLHEIETEIVTANHALETIVSEAAPVKTVVADQRSARTVLHDQCVEPVAHVTIDAVVQRNHVLEIV